MAPSTPVIKEESAMKVLTTRSLVAALLAVLVSWSAWGSPGTASADGGPHVYGQGMTTDACAGCHMDCLFPGSGEPQPAHPSQAICANGRVGACQRKPRL